MIIPDTKLFTIDCNPKPIPTLSAPAMIAIFVKLIPIDESAIIKPDNNNYVMRKPTKCIYNR